MKKNDIVKLLDSIISIYIEDIGPIPDRYMKVIHGLKKSEDINQAIQRFKESNISCIKIIAYVADDFKDNSSNLQTYLEKNILSPQESDTYCILMQKIKLKGS